ncbi:MAG TPA: hypothetical protein VGP88_03510 [Thermoplasmata archaeon]|nr:hypothetical protein [Thermoplasmata archaeon]
MYGAPGGYRPKPPSQGTAETLIIVAFVLQIIFSAVVLFFGAFGLLFGAFFFFSVGGALILVLAGIVVVIPILMLYVAYRYSYARTRDGDFAGARGPTLLLGIIGLIFGGLIVGILYIVAYVKLGDAESETHQLGGWPGGGAPHYGYPGHPAYGYPGPSGYGYPGQPGYGYPYAYGGGAPYGRPGAPTAGGVPYSPPPSAPIATTCPRCGRPATYIAQYGRSYCYSCTQYV